jgi:hypothetical protein
LLCLIVVAGGCARRQGRTVRLPAAAATAKARGADSAKQMREAIRSLKNRLGTEDAKADDAARDATGAPAIVPPGSGPTDPRGRGGVGTGGVWSVETRYPAAPGAAAPGGPAPSPRGRLLSRAGQAVRRATGGSWAGALVLCFLACVAVTALLLRRSRSHTHV